MTTINYGAFLSSGLVSVVIPSNVITIEDAAFSSCPNLTLVSISNTVTNISGNAFDWCPNLSSITVDNGNPIFDSRNNCNAIIETNTNKLILGCKETIIPNSVVSLGNTSFRGSGLTSIDIPENVTSIGGGTFQSCSSLSSITLPNALQKIEAYAFADCIALANIICYADVVPTAASNSFAGVQASAILHVPKASIELYKLKEPWKSFSIVGIRNPEYILTYFVNNEEYKKYSIEEGEKIVPEPAPMKEGYTFSGWNEIPETMPAKDIEVTGTFTINKYKLTYMVDGEEYKTYEVEYESSITPEDEPTKEGYTFSGWSEIPETMPAEDIEIKGTFEVNTYKLTYWVDGEEYQSYEIEYGTEITPEEEPIKQGYTFSGWSEIPETMSAEDIEITGTFEINTYKLTYMVDDEEYQSYEIEYGAEITPEDEPTKEGYTFSGWSEIPETMPSEDVTITGTFTKGSFKIIYLVDGEVYKTIGYDYGDTISPEDEPTKDGYTFSGWSDIPETMPAEDIEVTGTFEINTYKLTYMVDGEEYKSYEIKYGADITAEEEPTKEGYTFSGWSEIPSTMPADDITITGTFTINQYKLTYEVDGEEYKVLEIEYAATITPEVEPTKEGYTFSGWSEIPKTMPAEDVTVTGTFTVNSYKLTYMIGNDIYKVVVYEYGATIIPESQPEGDYANFEWVGLPETMPAKDVTVYANYETGIMGVEMLQDIQAIYTPNGKKLDKPQKDLNIIRTKDGKVSKVVIK